MHTRLRTRVEIAHEIADKMRDWRRLPEHYVDQRKQIMDEVEGLVDDWLEARA